MHTLTVRLTPSAYRLLQEIASDRDEAIPDALDRIVDATLRDDIFRRAAAAYAAIAADPVEAEAWRAEIAAWDATLLDGLEPEPELAELYDDRQPLIG
jgi:predicted transcriptional regulator